MPEPLPSTNSDARRPAPETSFALMILMPASGDALPTRSSKRMLPVVPALMVSVRAPPELSRVDKKLTWPPTLALLALSSRVSMDTLPASRVGDSKVTSPPGVENVPRVIKITPSTKPTPDMRLSAARKARPPAESKMVLSTSRWVDWVKKRISPPLNVPKMPPLKVVPVVPERISLLAMLMPFAPASSITVPVAPPKLCEFKRVMPVD